MERNVFLYGLLILVFLILVEAGSGARLPRSPQFGGGSFSQASAQAGATGGGPPGPVYYPGGGYGGGGYGGGGFGGQGYGRGGGYGGRRFGYGGRGFGQRGGAPLSISVAKSVSIGGK